MSSTAALEQRVTDVEADVYRLQHRADRTDDTLSSLAGGVNTAISEIRQLDARVDRLGSELLQAMAEIGQRQDGLDERFGGLEGRQEALEGRMEALEGRMEAVEGRLGAIEGLLGQILERLPA